ncbi:MAG: MFS transporter [Chloroflexi bacterium]|nr:MFS transporter [Chloroflexota bacterium]
MRNKLVWSNLSVYSLVHGLVDAACAATLFGMAGLEGDDLQGFFQLVLVYDVIAFATQPVFGWLVDRFKSPAQAAALGCLLVAVAALSTSAPMPAAVIAGVGNALFHVGGGVAILNLAPGKASLPGIFVAPGALGLTLGILLGRSGYFMAWPFIGSATLLFAALLIWFLPRVEYPVNQPPHAEMRWFEAAILLLLLSVAVRSLVGQSLVFPWKSDPALLIVLTLAVVMGKALGGLLADRLGWSVVAVTGLALSAPLLVFFSSLPALAIAGTFLFNLSMPVTLVCLAGMLPGKTGFAFGLTTLALILGALPTFTPLRAVAGQQAFLLTTIIVSVVALFVGLKLFDRHFRQR